MGWRGKLAWRHALARNTAFDDGRAATNYYTGSSLFLLMSSVMGQQVPGLSPGPVQELEGAVSENLCRSIYPTGCRSQQDWCQQT